MSKATDVNNERGEAFDGGRILSIPYKRLSPETLLAIIKEHITRDGTDYGEMEATLDKKIEQVQHKLVSGEAVIIFDTKEQACNIMLKDDPRIKGHRL